MAKRRRDPSPARAGRDEAARVARAEAIRLAAINAERLAEGMAPAHVRNPVFARDGSIVRGPMVEIINGRPTRINSVADVAGQRGELPPGLQHHDVIGELTDKSRMITSAHLAAARKLQVDWAEVGSGIGVSASDYAARSGSGGGSRGIHAPDTAILAQIDARARLEGALAWLGALCDVVAPVVLDCIPVAAWARQRGWDARHAVGYLAAAMTRLESFYEDRRGGGEPEPMDWPDRIRSIVTDDVASRTPALVAEETA